MLRLVAFGCGLLFGVGLCVSGMIEPAKVLGFLDLAGRWDPSLALVMAGGLAVAAPAYALARRRGRALTGEPIELPAGDRLDPALIGGSLLFGVGWGLVGFCPGPAIAALGFASLPAAIFVLAMIVGIVLADAARGERFRRPDGPRRVIG